MSVSEKDVIWTKFLGYLQEMAPKIYVSKSVRTLTQEALRASPDDPRLLAIDAFLSIVARPDKETNQQRFTF